MMSSTRSASLEAAATSAREERFPVSAIILTHNEEKNIAECLRSLDWAEDVIVVDSHSMDGTLDVGVQVRPDVRIFSHPFQDFGDQRNWAIDHTAPRHEWILFLDADERCDAACTEAVQAAVRDPGDKVGFYLTCRNWFLGRWIRR